MLCRNLGLVGYRTQMVILLNDTLCLVPVTCTFIASSIPDGVLLWRGQLQMSGLYLHLTQCSLHPALHVLKLRTCDIYVTWIQTKVSSEILYCIINKVSTIPSWKDYFFSKKITHPIFQFELLEVLYFTMIILDFQFQSRQYNYLQHRKTLEHTEWHRVNTWFYMESGCPNGSVIKMLCAIFSTQNILISVIRVAWCASEEHDIFTFIFCF